MVYNGLTPATNATLSGSVMGAVAGDTITLNTSGLALDYNTAHVLTANAINASGSAGFTIGTTTVSSLASDYSFTGPTIAPATGVGVNITAAPLTSTATIGGSFTKVYNGLTPATNATLSGSVSGAVAGDTITLNTSGLALDYNTAHVLTANAINASGSAGFTIGTTTVSSLASDYSFTGPTIAPATGVGVNITAAPLTSTA